LYGQTDTLTYRDRRTGSAKTIHALPAA